jgi:FkbM family methyltransferase
MHASPPEKGRSAAARAEAKAFFVEHVRATEAANDRMDLGRVDVFLRPEGVTVPRALRAVVEAARCQPPFLAIDVGANVGQTSSQMREELPAGTNIIAFEPGPVNLEGLRATARRAHFSDWRGGWRVIEAALTAPDLVPASGLGKFPRASHQVGTLSSTVVQGDLVDVVVSTLDVELVRGAPNATAAERAVEASAPIILLKIDTEGFDAHVLRGAEATLASRTVLGITFEYHWKWKDADPVLSLFNAQRMLADAGFSCLLATRNNLAPISGEWWDDVFELWTWSNVHCFPTCSRVLQRVVALYNADRGDTDFGGDACKDGNH